MVDRAALADRLFAERLAAPLRDRTLFPTSAYILDKDRVEAYVRKRGEEFQQELSSTAADVEWATLESKSEIDHGNYEKSNLRIVSALSRTAKRLIQQNGREMILHVDPISPGREILRWRFVSLAIPPGILIAAATPSGFASPSLVRLLDCSIAPDFAVAQHHLHHAAMISFEELWASLRLRALLHPDQLTENLCNERAICPELHRGTCFWGRTDAERVLPKKDPIALARDMAKHMAEWSDLLRQAFLAGRVLERHLYHIGPLSNCTDCRTAVQSSLSAFITGRTKPYSETPTRYPWPDELVGLAREESGVGAIDLSLDAGRSDEIRRRAAEERSLLARAFTYLRPEELESKDESYEKLLVQYLRVKSAVFGRLVHPPGKRGLTNFLDYFSQIKVYAPESSRRIPPISKEPGLQVVATECRIAPDAWINILRHYDREILKTSFGRSRDHEFAWLIHFKRDQHSADQPLFGSSIRRMEDEAGQISDRLDANPIYLRILRGIDVCGVEEMQPLWVAAETLRRLRVHSQIVCASRPALRLEPLRLTIHCGEDFSWLTSGMRAVAEPFYWRLIERGDRIGHGIAITLDPTKWWERHRGKIEVRRLDRLLDLTFLAVYADNRTPDQSEWLRLEIEQIARDLWPRPQDNEKTDFVETAKKFWREIGGRVTRRLIQTRRWDYGELHHVWLSRYLWEPDTQRRANDTISLQVRVEGNEAQSDSQRHERDLLIQARAKLIREVARWQICIESNPSSNLVVAGLDAMTSQDFLQNRATIISDRERETLTWSISTDDPITFSTTLADEYAYAWAGLVLRENGCDPSYARALLDEAAATSMRLRFTIPHNNRNRFNDAARWNYHHAYRG
jgi:hypothetical protein